MKNRGLGVGITVGMMYMYGMRREGRPKWRWTDSVNVALRERGLSGEGTQKRTVWRKVITVQTSTSHRSGEICGGKEEIWLTLIPDRRPWLLNVHYQYKNLLFAVYAQRDGLRFPDGSQQLQRRHVDGMHDTYCQGDHSSFE